MTTKKAYLIERSLSAYELEGLLVLLQHQEASVYVSSSQPELEAAGAMRWHGLTAEEKSAVNERLLRSLNQLGHVAAAKDTVAGVLEYKGFQTWYYHKFRINFALQQRHHQLESYKKLAQLHGRLFVYTKLQAPLSFSKTVPAVQFIPATAIARGGKQGGSFKHQLTQMWQRFMEGRKQVKTMKRPFPKHLLVLNHVHIRPLLDPANLPHLYNDNTFIGYFLQEWADQFLLIDKLLLEKSSHKATQLSEEHPNAFKSRQVVNNEWVEWRALLHPGTYLALLRYHKHLKRAYRQISKVLRDPLQQEIMQEVVKLHGSSLFFYTIFLAYKGFFKRHSFTSVTVLDEYSPNFRAIIDAARASGIRTQAIQHGSLAAQNPGYGYAAADKRFSPWPDRTLVWGEYWKELLIAIAAYPPEQLYVTGQIRTDVIPALQQKALSSDKILGSATAGKFLILLATQPQPDESLRKRAALDTFAVAKEMPNAWVLVKPHPRETDLSYYSSLAEETGCSNYSFVQEQDLFLLLRLSHVLVHCYSTVGIEAVYFGLPAIILDYLKQDLLRFAAEGVALQAFDADDLHQQLRLIQAGDYILDEKKAQAYIQRYACAIDGSASERTAQALLS